MSLSLSLFVFDRVAPAISRSPRADPPPKRFFVTPLHTETGVEEEGSAIAGRPCQKGRSPAALAADFPDGLFDFGVLGDPDAGDSTCWAEEPPGAGRAGFAHPRCADDRLEVFRGWLRSLELPRGARVAVVGHSGFFARFLGGEKMANCELVERPI